VATSIEVRTWCPDHDRLVSWRAYLQARLDVAHPEAMVRIVWTTDHERTRAYVIVDGVDDAELGFRVQLQVYDAWESWCKTRGAEA